MNPVIEVKNLCKEYKIQKRTPGFKGSVKALFKRKNEIITAIDNISFEINKGELVGFIGPNGAGKTTTLKTLSGLLHPTSGSTRVLGFTPFERDIKFLKQIYLIMGQKKQLYWDLPAIETFNMNKEIYEVDTSQYKKVLDELVDMLDLGDVIHQQVRKLSLGQRMKCEIVAALIHTPKVLFLDEPTIGLDVVSQKRLRQFIKDYNHKYESTIILTSHYMGDINELCKRVIIINSGKLVFDGNLRDLVEKYATSKYITLVFLHPVERSRAEEYGEIIEFDPLKVTFDVPRNLVREKASKMLMELPVDDLDISEIPVEDIIGDIFGEN